MKRLGCVQSCLCDRYAENNMFRPSEHAQPPYLYLPGMYGCKGILLCKVVGAKQAYVLHVYFCILYVFFVILLFV